MRVDFNNLTLNIKINEIDYGKAFDIKPGRCRAVVGFYGWNKSRKYTLMSYQYIV